MPLLTTGQKVAESRLMLIMKETYKRSYTAHVDSSFAREKQEVALENLVYVYSPSKRILSLSTRTLQNTTAFSSRNPPESFRTCASNTRSVGKASRAWSSGCIHSGRTQHRDSCVRPPRPSWLLCTVLKILYTEPGVSGLSTALELSKNPASSVTVVAKHI